MAGIENASFIAVFSLSSDMSHGDISGEYGFNFPSKINEQFCIFIVHSMFNK